MKRFYRQRKKTVNKPSKSRKKSRVTPERYVGPEYSEEETILRLFDMDMVYGPCLAMTRQERYERALKWGLNPPQHIETLLKTVHNVRSECLWYKRI